MAQGQEGIGGQVKGRWEALSGGYQMGLEAEWSDPLFQPIYDMSV